VESFAYAPNFITKIIQEEIGVDPDAVEASDTSIAQIKTRFPPEPNGYLHLGHAKAVSFNFAVAHMFQGTCNMRMDDTNPTKEDEEYVESILEDVKWIQSDLFGEANEPWEGSVRKTSGYFDTIYECAEVLIKQGDAYVDSLSAEEMREYRGTLTEPGKESPYRARSVEENLELFRKVGHFGLRFLEALRDALYLILRNNLDERRRMQRGGACCQGEN
jgi:glutaminyl-tRNA synthetase